MYNNQFGFNPYYQPMQNSANSLQNFANPIVNNKQMLNGKLVDSIDVVKATEANLDGSISYYPLTDGSAIVSKQLLNNGTSKTIIYKPIKENEEDFKFVTMEDLKKSIKEIDLSEIDDLKEEIKSIKTEIKKIKKGE